MKTKTEELMVIDGHKINFEREEFPQINDIREIYDINLMKSIDNCKNSLITKKSINNKNIWGINVNVTDRDVVQIEDNIYEIISGKEGLSVKLFGKDGLIFEFNTDKNFELDRKKYGKYIDCGSKNLKYYTSGDTSVISNDLTNRIVKYSSSENINNHTYTKYYEFLDSNNIAVYLLLIDFMPFRMTIYYDNNTKYDILNFYYKND